MLRLISDEVDNYYHSNVFVGSFCARWSANNYEQVDGNDANKRDEYERQKRLIENPKII